MGLVLTSLSEEGYGDPEAPELLLEDLSWDPGDETILGEVGGEEVLGELVGLREVPG